MCQGEHDGLQETALRSESQLESTRRSLMELDEDKQAGKEETESARWALILLHSLAFDALLPCELGVGFNLVCCKYR